MVYVFIFIEKKRIAIQSCHPWLWLYGSYDDIRSCVNPFYVSTLKKPKKLIARMSWRLCSNFLEYVFLIKQNSQSKLLPMTLIVWILRWQINRFSLNPFYLNTFLFVYKSDSQNELKALLNWLKCFFLFPLIKQNSLSKLSPMTLIIWILRWQSFLSKSFLCEHLFFLQIL